ncbi:deoxyribose-phosphate aldolase [Sporomusa malonica]|uniref:Deoxyribose-phosphate aldolase n=1 Tax=Sporomusa malonica TaxID=112901 RepID=A0A1W2ELE0_9FIRM|nr:deoxyribose-phosphate aldolase [Sporomusa malonica]SMD10465.1 deoxyribose-phosphate aldolase [Sporomusa malonica]
MNVELNKFVDHTLLKPDATVDQIIQLCEEAITYQFAAVCVNPCYAGLASNLLSGSKVKTATVIGFPLGATFSACKVLEVQTALEAKVDELDMVINLSALKSGQWDAVLQDIKAVVAAAEDKLVKVIVETALLDLDEKRRICELVLTSGAHFIKTSTGFVPGGATIEDITLFKSIIGDTSRCGIKASGGIKTRQQALAMLSAGATRIGTSAGVAILSTP